MSSSQQVAQQLYGEHQRWLYQWLCHKVGCPQQAQDLTQDTFINVLISPDLLTIRQARPFLATIARRLVANHYRRKKLEEAYLDALSLQPEHEHPSPEIRLLTLEILEKIDSALDGLPPQVREAFLLAHLQGMRYNDIAERLRISSSSVKQYLQRANLHCFFSLNG